MPSGVYVVTEKFSQDSYIYMYIYIYIYILSLNFCFHLLVLSFIKLIYICVFFLFEHFVQEYSREWFDKDMGQWKLSQVIDAVNMS